MSRARLLAAALVLGSAAACKGESRPAVAGAAPDEHAALYRADPRVAELLQPCATADQRLYDRDTTYLLPVLIDKLEHGAMEPMRRAKEEIGTFGAEAAEALRRTYERHAASAYEAPIVENALDAAALHPGDEAREVLLLGITHPQSSVRQKALVGLVQHVRPEDFERLLQHVEGAEEPLLRSSFARALFDADAPRAARLAVDWIRRGAAREVWRSIAPLVAESHDPDVAAGLAELWSELPEDTRAFYAAPPARAGDARALEFLRSELEQQDPVRKTNALQALDAAGAVEELLAVLREDPDEALRVLALDAIASERPWTDAQRGWLHEALDDPSATVRALALRLLVEGGDAAATDRALALLEGDGDAVQLAVGALREQVREDLDLARRVLERLLVRHELESHRPHALRTTTYKAFGLLPLEEAARFLRRAALEAGDEAVIESLRAHEWLMIQASNTGPAGRAFLRDELAAEEHPLRRLDLLMALGSERDELAREGLLAVAEQGARSPYEVLYAAGRLVRIGPGSLVAPRLKRVSYAVEDGQVRVALQCLLWTWY